MIPIGDYVLKHLSLCRALTGQTISISGFIFVFFQFHVPKTDRCPHEVSGGICSVCNPLQTSWFTALLNGLVCKKLMSNSIKKVLRFIWGWRNAFLRGCLALPQAHTSWNSVETWRFCFFVIPIVEPRDKSCVI